MAISLDKLMKLEPEEMLKHDEFPTIEELRDKEQLYYDDVEIGQELPKYIRKRSGIEFFRWSATVENTHRLHYDYPHSYNHDKLPGILFGGTHRRSVIASWLKNWTLPGGWVWKFNWQLRQMVTAGEITILWGRVIDKRIADGMGLVDIEWGILNQDNIDSNPGTATLVLPVRGGTEIPYPFVAPVE